MIPQIVFNEKEKRYFPAADFYEITRSPNAHNHIMHIYDDTTTCACSFMLLNILELRAQIRNNDPSQEYSSKIDVFSIWDQPLSRISFTRSDLSDFKKFDIIATEGASITIPNDDKYNKFIYMTEIMKKCNYYEKIMYEKMIFKNGLLEQKG